MKDISREERDYIISKEPNALITICSKFKKGRGSKTYYLGETSSTKKLLKEYRESQNVIYDSEKIKIENKKGKLTNGK